MTCLYSRETPHTFSGISGSSQLFSFSLARLGLKLLCIHSGKVLWSCARWQPVCAAGNTPGFQRVLNSLTSTFQGVQREALVSLGVPTYVPPSMQSYPGLHKAYVASDSSFPNCWDKISLRATVSTSWPSDKSPRPSFGRLFQIENCHRVLGKGWKGGRK